MTSHDQRTEPGAVPRSDPAGGPLAKLTVASYAGAVTAGLVGLCGMAGWIADIEGLRDIVPHQPAIRFNSALALALLALTWFVPRGARLASAGLAAVIGLATLVEYAVGVDGGIDELFVADPAHIAHPGRMAVATAASCVLLAAGRILAELGRARDARMCAALVVIIDALTLLGYAYNSSWLYDIRPVSTLALNAAGALLLLGLALIAALPTDALTWSIGSDDSGAVLTRRLLPVALVGLPIVGALALFGQRHQLYDGTTTASVIVVACVVVVGVVTWAAAVRLSRTDRRRALAIDELTELKDDLERQVDQRATQLQRRQNDVAVLEDRQRIAADLHDIVIQRLFAAGMFLQGSTSSVTDPDTRQRVDTAVEAMDAAIKDLRASIFALGGRRHLPVDIATAAESICVESARVLGFRPHLVVDDPKADTERVRDDILAVLRESLANVARHARASKVDVVVRSRDGLISLTVVDDGVGMGESATSSGTRNMTHRARDHGGDCIWSALDPSGTRVCWSIPVRADVGT